MILESQIVGGTPCTISRHPLHHLTAPQCAVAPWLGITALGYIYVEKTDQHNSTDAKVARKNDDDINPQCTVLTRYRKVSNIHSIGTLVQEDGI